MVAHKGEYGSDNSTYSINWRVLFKRSFQFQAVFFAFLGLYTLFLLALTSFVLLNFSPATANAFSRVSSSALKTASEVSYYLSAGLLGAFMIKASISLLYVSIKEECVVFLYPLLLNLTSLKKEWIISDLLSVRAHHSGYRRDTFGLDLCAIFGLLEDPTQWTRGSSSCSFIRWACQYLLPVELEKYLWRVQMT